MNKITVDAIKTRLYDDKDKKGWLSALPADVNKFIWEKALWNTFKKCPNANGSDFVECCLKAVRDGLIPDGREAVIYHFGKKPTYIPMIAGVIKRIYSGNVVKRLVSHIVHEHDEFDLWTDNTGDNVIFRPLLKGDRGIPIGAFAMGFMHNGDVITRYMGKEEIDKRRKKSKTGGMSDSPWAEWWDEMAKKTVIHNMFKMIPLESAQHDMLLDSIQASKETEMVDVSSYPQENTPPNDNADFAEILDDKVPEPTKTNNLITEQKDFFADGN